MKISSDFLRIMALTGSTLLFTISVIVSCAPTSQVSSTKGGAELWGQNCIRCHNTPSPDTFSDVEWEVAVAHMRVRAYLTEEETDKIVEFLKTAN